MVHHLYRPGGRAVSAVLAAFPGAGSPDEGVDRAALSRLALASPDGLLRLEAIVHPAVLEAQREWVEEYRAQARDRLAEEAARKAKLGEGSGTAKRQVEGSEGSGVVTVSEGAPAPLAPPPPPPALIMDVPLLFETKGESRCDATLVVSAPEAVQRERVLARPGMTEHKLAAILKRQLHDAEKRARADFIIDTSVSRDETRAQVEQVVVMLQRLAKRREEAAVARALSEARADADANADGPAADDAIRAAVVQALREVSTGERGGQAEAGATGDPGRVPALGTLSSAAPGPLSPGRSPASPPPSPATIASPSGGAGGAEPTFPRLSLPRRSPSLGPLGSPAKGATDRGAAPAAEGATAEAVRGAEARLQAAETAAAEAED